MCRSQASRQPNQSIDATLDKRVAGTGTGETGTSLGVIERDVDNCILHLCAWLGASTSGRQAGPPGPPFFGGTVRFASYRFVGLLVPPLFRYCLQGLRRAAGSAMRVLARVAASSAPN